MLAPAAVFGFALIVAFAVSALEAAVISLPEERVTQLESSGRRGAWFVAALKARLIAFLATVWALRIAAIATAAISARGPVGELIEAGLITDMIAVAVAGLFLLLGEVVARAVSLRNPERVCLALSLPVWFVSRALLVLIRPLEALARLLSKGLAERLPRISDREIRDLVSPGSGDHAIDEHERRLIQRAFLLDQTTAYDVMVPRVDIFAWPETRKLSEIVPDLRSVRYSRVPLYNGSIDKITGVLYIRDAFCALVSGQRDAQLRALAREPFFVPGSLTLDKLLLDFQTKRIHLGIVIDEYGGVDGLITLEDILEELVGEIVDESDVSAQPIVRLSRNEILVNGGTDLREINHFFNTAFPQVEHRSLNGYLLDVLGHVPSPGERIVKEGVLIEITEATETQVVRARLSQLTPERAGTDEAEAALEIEPGGAGRGLGKGTSPPGGGRSSGKERAG